MRDEKTTKTPPPSASNEFEGEREGGKNEVGRSLLVVRDSPKLGGRSSLFTFYSFCEIPPSFSPTKLLNPVPFSAREKDLLLFPCLSLDQM